MVDLILYRPAGITSTAFQAFRHRSSRVGTSQVVPGLDRHALRMDRSRRPRMPPETAGCLEALRSVCDLEHDLSRLVRRTIRHAVGGARVGEVENLADRQAKPPAVEPRRESVEPAHRAVT